MIKMRVTIQEDGLLKEGLTDSLPSSTRVKDLQTLVTYMKEALVTTARTVLKEEQGKGFDKNPLTIIDGKRSEDLNSVKPFGYIEFDAKVASEEFLIPIYQSILDKSKVVTGLYLESNFVYAGGILIAKNMQQFKAWVASSKVGLVNSVRFVNTMPYAGKMERLGLAASRQQDKWVKSKDRKQRSGPKVRQPNGTYFLSAKAINKQFKHNASIKFEWVNGRTIDLSQSATQTKGGKPLRRTFHPDSGRKGTYVYPSIMVRFNKGGVTL